MNFLKTNSVLNEVLAERLRQEQKWGEQNHPDGTDDHWNEWGGVLPATASGIEAAARAMLDEVGQVYSAILMEEVGEALSETDPVRLRAELIQVAAVAVQWIEAIDRRMK